MELLDNVNHTVKDDLCRSLKQNSKISVAANCFSIYAYKELRENLKKIKQMNFIFTSPTFIKEEIGKQQKEFYISKINREKSIYGTAFEIKLKNELTQKAIAKECSEWIREKVRFKSNITQDKMMGFMNVDDSTFMPFNAFTTVDLGSDRGDNAYYPVQKQRKRKMVDFI